MTTADDSLLFKLVLDDPLGLSLRNRTGHGLVRRRECTLENVLLVMQCYLVVASQPPVSP